MGGDQHSIGRKAGLPVASQTPSQVWSRNQEALGMSKRCPEAISGICGLWVSPPLSPWWLG